MNQTDYVTKEYLDKTLEEKLDSKFKLWSKDIKQHMTDLKTVFREDSMIIYDQVKALGDKINQVNTEVSEIKIDVRNIDQKVTIIQDDVILIKDVLEDKTDKRDVSILKQRITKLKNRSLI